MTLKLTRNDSRLTFLLKMLFWAIPLVFMIVIGGIVEATVEVYREVRSSWRSAVSNDRDRKFRKNLSKNKRLSTTVGDKLNRWADRCYERHMRLLK